MRKPTSTRAGAVASLGTTPTIGEMNIASRNSTPVTTLARPVRAPDDTPAADSMYVVLLDALMRPPNAAPTESTSRTRLIPGSRPFASSQPAWPPMPTTVPMVSKKSESMIVKTARTVATTPILAKASKFSPWNAVEKFGAANRAPGQTALPSIADTV